MGRLENVGRGRKEAGRRGELRRERRDRDKERRGRRRLSNAAKVSTKGGKGRILRVSYIC